MLLSRIDIPKFIPQRQPIVVVHGLVSHSDNSTTSEFKVENNHLFVRNGNLLESGLMENIAQTAALRAGYAFSLSATDKEKTEPPIGFIASLKNFTIHYLPHCGDVLHTTVTTLHNLMGMEVVQGKVMIGKKLVAECEMKIFLADGK